MKCQVLNSFHKLEHSRITCHQIVFPWLFTTFCETVCTVHSTYIQKSFTVHLAQDTTEFAATERWKQSCWTVTQILRWHQETPRISSPITALLNLHRGSKLPVPEILTGHYKLQNLTQKGYVLMKLEERNDLLRTQLFAKLLFSTELKLFGWLVTEKCRSKHTNKSLNHNNISVTEIRLDKL